MAYMFSRRAVLGLPMWILAGGLLVAALGKQTTAVGATAAAAPLRARDFTRFFVTPNQPAVLSWKLKSPVRSRAMRWRITNYWGRRIVAGTSLPANNTINLSVRLPRGFYQITFPGNGQKFGVVSIAAHHGPAGHFFSIDSAMSWLVNNPTDRQAVRVGMIRILRRSGIGMSRERLSWAQINPAVGKFDWNKDYQYGRLANDYFHNGVRMLQMFSDAPAWTHPDSGSPYPPVNLVQTARSWAVIGSYFHKQWGALETWNEPDGSGTPPDQLLSMVKAIAYSFQRADLHIPLVGGVFALSVPGFFQSDCAMNGLLDQVNVISFHYYFTPPTKIPTAVAAYRHYLAAFGKPSMPLWITESGKPWPAGTARPHRGPDITTALWITMNAVEARACGIARYFAFVYPFFVQGADNFGMMGQEHTPLRSMAAYVNCVSELSGWSYAGNLKVADHAVLLAPVFARGDRRTAVVYTGDANPHAAFGLALHGISIRGIDGRKLQRNARGAIPIPDGLVYLRGPAGAFAGKIKTETEAGRLYAISRQPPPTPQHHSPIILQLAHPRSAWSAEAHVPPNTAKAAIAVRVWNLANHAITVRLTMRGRHAAAGHKPVALSVRRRIPARGDVLVKWMVRHPERTMFTGESMHVERTQLNWMVRHPERTMGLGIVHYHYLVVTGQEMPANANTPAISQLAIPLRSQGTYPFTTVPISRLGHRPSH